MAWKWGRSLMRGPILSLHNCNRRLPITMYSGNVCTAGPAGRTLFWNAPGNALRMVDVGCELNSETRGIDVTRRAESIGEGIRV